MNFKEFLQIAQETLTNTRKLGTIGNIKKKDWHEQDRN